MTASIKFQVSSFTISANFNSDSCYYMQSYLKRFKRKLLGEKIRCIWSIRPAVDLTLSRQTEALAGRGETDTGACVSWNVQYAEQNTTCVRGGKSYLTTIWSQKFSTLHINLLITVICIMQVPHVCEVENPTWRHSCRRNRYHHHRVDTPANRIVTTWQRKWML